MTIDALQRTTRLAYRPGRLVLRFATHDDHVEVTSLRTDTGAVETDTARRLVLAAGVLGTARIVLRSRLTLQTTILAQEVAMLQAELRERREPAG